MSVGEKWRALALVATAELFAMTLWFSVSAVAPSMTAAWNLTPTETAWLTIAVQIGFVVGAMLLAILTLADKIQPQYLFAGDALGPVVAAVGTETMEPIGAYISETTVHDESA